MDHPPHSQDSGAKPEDDVRTPGWLTATGIGLFVLAGVGWLMTRPPPPTLEQMRQESMPAASAEAPAEPKAAPSAAPARPAGSGPARPAGSGPVRPAPGMRFPRPPGLPGGGN